MWYKNAGIPYSLVEVDCVVYAGCENFTIDDVTSIIQGLNTDQNGLSWKLTSRKVFVVSLCGCLHWVIMKFLFLRKKKPSRIHGCMMQTLSSKYHTQLWRSGVLTYSVEIQDRRRSKTRSPSAISPPETVDNVCYLISAHRRISAKAVTVTLETSRVCNSCACGKAETISQVGAGEMFE